MQTRNRSGWQPSTRTAFLLLCICLAIATILLYYPVGGHPFLNYDDDVYVQNNSHIKAGLSWATVGWAFTSFYASNWHPLTWLSHALDYQWFGLDAGKHHETNLLLHVINVLLLFGVLWRATSYMGRSAMVAALLALHPINVESVAWIAERKNLLSMMFFLLALCAYTWYARKPHMSRYLAVVALYILGLMAKPQVITLPCVLLLWDYWPLQRMYRNARETFPQQNFPAMPLSRLIWEKLPLLALSAASALITIRAQYEGGAMTGPHWQPISARIENAIVAYARYLGKALWPSDLELIYPHPGSSLKIWQVLSALLLLAAITAVVISARRRHRYLLTGWLWFLGTMLPMIGLLQVGVQAMADRYAYLPFVGLFIMICWGASEWADRRQLSVGWQMAVGVVVLVGLGLTARRQLNLWSDNTLLWSRIVSVESQGLQASPNNWVAEDVLGHALLNLGEVEAAIPHFRAAMTLNPSDPDSNVNVGTYEQRRRNLPGAIAQYQKVIAMTQSTPRLDVQSRAQAFSNMGYAYRELKDYGHARENFEQAVKINPEDARSWLGIGIMAHKSGDLKTAVAAYTNALKTDPFDWGYLLVARALDESGRHQEADTARQKAAALSQNLEQARKMADQVLAK